MNDKMNVTATMVLDSIALFNARLASPLITPMEAEKLAGVINNLSQALLNLRNARNG